jgi:type II secretory pathway pseudopilin PulG
VQKCREFAAALIARALFRIHEGRTYEAWQDLLACHRLGRLIARGGTLIELLVGIAIDMMASHGDVAYLDYAKPTSTQVSACFDDLRNLPPMPNLADKIDQCERLFCLDAMLLTARHGMTFLESFANENNSLPENGKFGSELFTWSVNWDPALRNANLWFDRDVAALRIKERNARVKELAAIVQDLKNLKPRVGNAGISVKPFMSPNGRGEMIGNIMIALLTPAFLKLQNATERCEQTQRNLHVAFALVAYQRDNGRYPATLEELAPKYLDHIPDDLFSGKPLIYRPNDNGYLLYSVGVNGINEDGNGYDDDPRGDDLSVRIPVPRPLGKD